MLFGDPVRMLNGGFNEQCVYCSSRSLLRWRQLHHWIRSLIELPILGLIDLLCYTHAQTVTDTRSFTHGHPHVVMSDEELVLVNKLMWADIIQASVLKTVHVCA